MKKSYLVFDKPRNCIHCWNLSTMKINWKYFQLWLFCVKWESIFIYRSMITEAKTTRLFATRTKKIVNLYNMLDVIQYASEIVQVHQCFCDFDLHDCYILHKSEKKAIIKRYKTHSKIALKFIAWFVLIRVTFFSLHANSYSSHW